MTSATPVRLHFRVGARSLFSVCRRLRPVPVSLGEALAARTPPLPALAGSDQGWIVRSWPQGLEHALQGSGASVFIRQRYSRRYADLTLGWEAYLATFSAKSRQTLARKRRRFAEIDGGVVDCRRYEGEALARDFLPLARGLSELTYQERLLGAGLPAELDPGAIGWLLFLQGQPIAYLYTPAAGDTLIYAHLGYDPAAAEHSPGTVLQIEAMRALMEEGRFRLFDFTEGDGPHKRLFSTAGVDCLDALVLRRTPGNLLVAAALAGFDRAVEGVKRLAGKLRIEDRLRAFTR